MPEEEVEVLLAKDGPVEEIGAQTSGGIRAHEGTRAEELPVAKGPT